MNLFSGRRKPYTQIGIGRVPCVRCGRPSTQQWQICANGNRYLGICTDCDIKLNALALRFMNVKNRRTLLRRYRAKLIG